MQSTVELLAPAGDREALKAAVANGADAVYFGLSAFNARARAANFTLEELPELMQYLHARGVKGFVAFNTLIFTNELPEALTFIKAIAAAGVDAVIVQDLGLVTLIRQAAPSLAIHASTQMTLTEPRGLAFAQALGVERAVLARELSVAEIKTITAATTLPVEVFVHGALCVAYSGQCLTSEALGGRSANRGQCAQACRLPYEMIVDGVLKPLGDKAYLLSPQDLAAHDHIAPLINAGVISFKIEGRLKNGPYVAATTQTYRAAIDATLNQQPFQLSRQKQLDLAQVFSRGLTPGFLDGNDHQKLVRGRFPKSRGVRLGVVKRVTPRGVEVTLAERVPDFIQPGDGVLFDLGKPGENEPGGRVWHVEQRNHGVVELRFQEGFDTSRISVGIDVWKTDSPSLNKRLEQTYKHDTPAKKEAIDAVIQGVIDGPVTLTLRRLLVGQASEPVPQAPVKTGGQVQRPVPPEDAATWPGPLQLATKTPTSHDDIRTQLARLGDTHFELKELKFELPDNVMMPKSVLNALRREAVEALLKHPAATQSHAVADANALQSLRSQLLPRLEQDVKPQLTILCRTLEQLDAALALKPEAVDCDFEDLKRYMDAVPKARAAGVPIGLATLRIQKPGEEGLLSLIARAEPDRVLIRNLAGLAYFQEHLPDAERIGDFSLNTANELTADLLLKSGLQTLVPSFDLNWDQFAALMQASDPLRFQPVIHQHMPMFHMEHCVFAAFLSTGKDHRDCGRPCDTHKVELKDRVGAHFPVLPDTGCRNTVYNSVAQSAAEYVGKMLQLGVRRFRIDLVNEKPAQVPELFQVYTGLLGGDSGKATWRNLKAINQLGVTRGTLQMV